MNRFTVKIRIYFSMRVAIICGIALMAFLPVTLSFAQPVSFSPAINYAVGTKPSSVAVGDFNGDGNIDLAVANIGSNNVSILLGTGYGTFGPSREFAVGENPNTVAIGDFNRDGKLDLVVVNRLKNISILLGDGAGSFGPAVNFDTGSVPTSVAIGDFNGDGKLDLSVTTYSGSGIGMVGILLGDGNGSFSPVLSFIVGAFPTSIAAGDFNEDGKLDLAVTTTNLSYGGGLVVVLLGDGTGSFRTVPNLYGGGINLVSAVVGDFNRDGHLDLAFAENLPFGIVHVFSGDGTGFLEGYSISQVQYNPSSVAVGDFNGDGFLDMAVTRQVTSVSILLGHGTEFFGLPTNFDAAYGPSAVAVGDFNGDGKPDLAVANFDSNNISILLNTTVFPPSTTTTTTTTTSTTTTTTTTSTTTSTRPTTTTITTTTTTLRSTIPDVGIRDIKGVPKKIDAGKEKKVEVKVKNFSDTTQTRNVSLFLNGTPVGAGVLVTLGGGQQEKVKFDVEFDTPGTATLEASLFPGDSNPTNDTKTVTVKVGKGKNKDKGKDKDK